MRPTEPENAIETCPGGAAQDRDRCVLIGTAGAIEQLYRQLFALPAPPRVLGVLLFHDAPDSAPVREFARRTGLRILGEAREIPEALGDTAIDYAIVTLPAVMNEAIMAIRTLLRREGIPDRFVATLQDQLAGVGPRTQIDIDVSSLIDRRPHEIDEASIRAAITGKRILITGAGGSIGSELARIVARFDPSELFLMERSENALFEIDRQIAQRHPKLRRGAWLHDVTDEDKTLAWLIAARPQVIFHAAAHKHVPMMEDHPVEAIVNNFFGTKSIADAAAQTSCERFVMISTDKAVNPSSIMGGTKRLAELYIQYMNQRSDCRFNMVRFGNVLGSNGSVLTIWSDQLRSGGPITVTDPAMTRYFMTIPEAASLVIQAASLEDEAAGGAGAEILLLDMGAPINILEMAKRFIEAHGLQPLIRSSCGDDCGANRDGVGNTAPRFPSLATGDSDRRPHAGEIDIVFTGVRPGEKLFEELACDGEGLTPTSHPGIRVWAAQAPSAERIGDMVATLTEVVERGGGESAITAIRRLLPETQLPGVKQAARKRRMMKVA